MEGFLEHFDLVWEKKREGYLLGEPLGAEGRSEKGSSNGRLVGYADEKIEGYPIGESLSADDGSEIRSSNGMSDGNGDGNIEIYPMGD